jgi:hypothetical protein
MKFNIEQKLDIQYVSINDLYLQHFTDTKVCIGFSLCPL